MYLTEPERKKIMNSYSCNHLIEDNHYQVEPDTWVYLYHDPSDRKYVLIVADYLDLDYENFPQLLRFNNNEFTKVEFVLQKEIPSHDPKVATNSSLFEYA